MDTEKQIRSTLDDIVKSGKTFRSVPEEDGKALRLLAEASGAKVVVEIGTSTGCSGLWLCLGIAKTGGHLTTIDADPGRAATAREHFRKAGVENIVTILEGDAHVQLARVKGPIDLAFIDADKEGYVAYLKALLPMMRPGGLILAHNLDMIPDYVKAVHSNPELETILYQEGNGLVVSLKKR